MLNLPQSIIDAFKSQISHTCILLDLELTSVSGNKYFMYFTDNDIEVYYKGNKYTPVGIKINEFEYSIGSEVDTLNIVIDNVGLIPISIFLNKEQRGNFVILYFCALDKNIKPIGAFEIFRGFINTLTFKELEETSICEISVTHEFALWKKETLRPQTYRCPWRFKDVNCGYSGSATWCDKSYERCQQLNNTSRFGGFPHLADLEEKEIWWGRKPK